MFEQKNNGQNEQNSASSYIRSPEVDENDPLAPYRPHIDNFDLTEDEKLELVGAVHCIVHMVLDVKFGTMKQQLSSQKPVDDTLVTINGVRYEG